MKKEILYTISHSDDKLIIYTKSSYVDSGLKRIEIDYDLNLFVVLQMLSDKYCNLGYSVIFDVD